MTLRRRLGNQIVCSALAVLAMAGWSLLAMRGLRNDVGFALRANEQLREIYTIGTTLAEARSELARDNGSLAVAQGRVEAAMTRFEANHSWLAETGAAASELAGALRAARRHLDGDAPHDMGSIDPAYRALADLSAATRRVVEARGRDSDAAHARAVFSVGAIACLIVAGFAIAALRQYRIVMRPLEALRGAARKIADDDLSSRAPVAGDLEIRSVAEDFNRMADHLQLLNAELEERVRTKSRELARSERLASVGYLAAGVAHEINNPLGIIAGYAERAIRQIDRDPAQEPRERRLRAAFELICEESFRCKAITDRLLALARPSDETRDARQVVDLRALARDVVASLEAIGRIGQRRITVQSGSEQSPNVAGNEGEIRQVLLNLVVNAIDATDPAAGEIRIEIRCKLGQVEMQVADNGRGMDDAALLRVFEPFFTTRSGGGSAGTGLGLSIAHAIVADHHGTLEAASEGLGRGCRFTVRLPEFENSTNSIHAGIA